MFISFFYGLREAGIPVSPTAFLTLHRALAAGLVSSLEEFYSAARSILVKSERWFDRFDQVFAHAFRGAELPEPQGLEIDALARALLESWLRDPGELARALGLARESLAGLSPDALLELFRERLREQTEAHHAGSRWIGTRGTSPFGHSGVHPGGMRVGGVSRNRSAVRVALERRYRDYSQEGPLTQALVGEALKRLRHLVPAGPCDRVDVAATIRRTVRNAGEIEIVFARALRDRLQVILAIDNGGWSMDPYIPVVQTLFDYARSQFKDLKTYFFHNTIYATLWEDPARLRKPQPIADFSRLDPATRLIIVGDASMAPWELYATDGAIALEERSGKPSIACLQFLAETFRHRAWLNPRPADTWAYTRTIGAIRGLFPMFELTLDGLEQAVAHLLAP